MSKVRRRCVFYVSGFDPKGAGHYHALYRDQACLQAQAGGLKVEVGPRRRGADANPFWMLDATEAGHHVQTRYEFMRWDDVVRAHWPRQQLQLWRDVFATTWFNLRHGSLWKMYRLSWPPALALVTPFLLLCAMAICIPGLAGLAGWAALRSGGAPAAAIAAVGAAFALVWIGRRVEARFAMYWMMRSYAFTARQAQGRTPELERRLDEHASRLAARLRESTDDEILVVGHSSGAIMAGCIVARALQQLNDSVSQSNPRPVLSLITLGQWIPLLGLLPHAVRFREELACLATAAQLDWIDFSAPPDGCCFALSDPIVGSGVTVDHRAGDRPKLLSPRFAQMFSPAAYRALKRDKFRLHFQYLMASELPGDYDYFRITAGSATLADRYAGHLSVTGYRELSSTPK